MAAGAVWVSKNKSTKRLRRATKILSQNDKIHVYYKQHIIELKPQDCQLIADEGDYSVWNKPYGTFSQGTMYGDHCTVQRYAEKHLKPQRNAFIVHRLDRDANGLILLAHSKKAAALLSALFKHRKIKKNYQVIVMGHLQLDNIPFEIDQDIDGKASLSTIEELFYSSEKNQTTLDVSIGTGRKHQIRKHMAFLGHPVVGDKLYASTEQNKETELKLRAWKLAFNSPFSSQKPSNLKVYQLDSKI